MSKTARQKPTSQMMVSRKKEKQVFKIIVIGDSGIGKTCLTYRFCSGMFPTKTEATIGVDFRERIVEVEGEEIKLQLWDTAGQERFRKSMVQHYYRNVHAVVFVYDVTKIATFDSLPHWIKECEENQLTDSIPRILVGNKCDCKEQVVVNLNMAQKFADFHSMPVFETSAKDDSGADHVEAIFMTLAQKLKNSKLLMPPSPYKQVVGGNGTSNFTIPVKKSHCAHKYSAPTHSTYEEEVWCAC